MHFCHLDLRSRCPAAPSGCIAHRQTSFTSFKLGVFLRLRKTIRDNQTQPFGVCGGAACSSTLAMQR